jgi:hypothetical protein
VDEISCQHRNWGRRFNAWEKSKADPEIHQFIRYLVDWVAGTKLIFIALLVVILLTVGEETQLFGYLLFAYGAS